MPKYREAHWTTREFYDGFKEAFLRKNPFIMENQHILKSEFEAENYVIMLYYDLEKEFFSDGDFQKFYNQYLRLKKTYGVYLRWKILEKFVDFLISQGKPKEAYNEWIILQEEVYKEYNYWPPRIERLMHFESIFKHSLMNGYHIYRIAGNSNLLTEFGKRNLDGIFKVIDTIIMSNIKVSFFELFFKDYSFDEAKRTLTFPVQYYKQFFTYIEKSKKFFEWRTDNTNRVYGDEGPASKDGFAAKNFVFSAILHEANRLLREGENEYRLSIGAKKVGESWISETELFYKLKKAFDGHEVIHHGRPDWLGRQHFDIWFPELKVAIEYQGKQHDEPVEFFGGKKGFEQNKKRDLAKKAKSEKNNVTLIEVRENYDLDKLVTEIKGLVKE